MQKLHDDIIVDYALAFKNGEEKGFDFFYRTWYAPLALFAFSKINDRAEAEDIASEAFIKIWKRHQQFNTASEIRGYLYKIIRNDCLKFLEHQKRKTSALNGLSHDVADPSQNIEADLIRLDFFAELYEASNVLSTQTKKVFDLLFIQGKNVKETARQLNVSVSTIKTQKVRSIHAMRKKLNLTSIIFRI